MGYGRQEQYATGSDVLPRCESSCVDVLIDDTSSASFERSKSWIAELAGGSVSMVIALTGNKTDLDDAREVSTSDAQQFAKTTDSCSWKLPAKNVNIRELFQMVAKHLPKGPRQAMPPRCSFTTSQGMKGVCMLERKRERERKAALDDVDDDSYVNSKA